MEMIRFVRFHPKIPPPGWKCPKRFKLGVGLPWESTDSEDDSERETSEGIRFCRTNAPPGWKCPKRFKLGVGPPWESDDSKGDSETEMDELPLIALQRYEERDKQNGIVDKQRVLECEQDGDVATVKTIGKQKWMSYY